MTKNSLKLATAAIMLLAVAGCSSNAPEATDATTATDTTEADIAEIKRLVATELEGGTKQDIDLVMSIYCDSPETHLFESGPYVVQGYDKLKEAWTAYFKAFKSAEASYTDLVVGASGDLGYAHALHNWKFTTHDGEVREDQHRVTHVYKRMNGKWCIIHENDSVPVKIVDIDEHETSE